MISHLRSHVSQILMSITILLPVIFWMVLGYGIAKVTG